MDIRKDVQGVIDGILTGKILDTFDKYYADKVVMSENGADERVGKATNRQYEEAFLANTEFHSAKVGAIVVDGNNAAVEWTFEVTPKGGAGSSCDKLLCRRGTTLRLFARLSITRNEPGTRVIHGFHVAKAPSVRRIGSRVAMSDAGIVDHYVEERRASTAGAARASLVLRGPSEHGRQAAVRTGSIPERMACNWRLQQGIHE